MKPPSHRTFLGKTLRLIVLYDLSVFGPVFGLLANNEGFFSARHATPNTLVLFIGLWAICLPTLFLMAEYFAARIPYWPQQVIHLFLVHLLLLLGALQIFNVFDHGATIVFAPMISVALTFAYARTAFLKKFLNAMFALHPILIISFFSLQYTQTLLFPPEGPASSAPQTPNPKPQTLFL